MPQRWGRARSGSASRSTARQFASLADRVRTAPCPVSRPSAFRQEESGRKGCWLQESEIQNDERGCQPPEEHRLRTRCDKGIARPPFLTPVHFVERLVLHKVRDCGQLLGLRPERVDGQVEHDGDHRLGIAHLIHHLRHHAPTATAATAQSKEEVLILVCICHHRFCISRDDCVLCVNEMWVSKASCRNLRDLKNLLGGCCPPLNRTGAVADRDHRLAQSRRRLLEGGKQSVIFLYWRESSIVHPPTEP